MTLYLSFNYKMQLRHRMDSPSGSTPSALSLFQPLSYCLSTLSRMLPTLILSVLFSVMAHIPTIYAQPPSSAISPKVFIISMVCRRQGSSSSPVQIIKFNLALHFSYFNSYATGILLLPNQKILSTSLNPRAKYGTTTSLSLAWGIFHLRPSPLPAFPCSSHASSAPKPAQSVSSQSGRAKSTLPSQ